MPKPQPLPKPIPEDLAQLKALIDDRSSVRDTTLAAIQSERENLDDCHRQLKRLQATALKILKIEEAVSSSEPPAPQPIP